MAARLKCIKAKWSKKRGRKESSVERNAQFIETAQGTEERSVSLTLVCCSFLHIIVLSVFVNFVL